MSTVDKKHGSVNVKAAKPISSGFILSVSIFSGITAIILFKDEEKRSRLFKLLKNKLFLISLAIIIGFSIYTLNLKEDTKESEKLRSATKHALVGFTIAILAYLELKAAPFWIIWLVTYYLDI